MLGRGGSRLCLCIKVERVGVKVLDMEFFAREYVDLSA
jgi:hypothetical protein